MSGQGGPGDQRRGEVNELRQLLRNKETTRDGSKMREAIKKVIAYMTLGIDVSALFSDMVMASSTRDLVIKKMVYLYLCTYAQNNPELALLAINTLTKDCVNEDPTIRGLALRSLSSLRLPATVEYVVPMLQRALKDSSPYVRKTGVVGILKLHHLAPAMVAENDMTDTLYAMLRDRDPMVVVNCIYALREIMADEGGMAINQPIVHHLLNRIRDFSEWGQCVVLDLVAQYQPPDDSERFALMNLLDDCLRVANSAVVLATAKVMLHLTRHMEGVHRQVYLRLCTPLLTLLATPSHEITFAVLAHLLLLAKRCPGAFDAEYKQFFCKFNEPTYVRALKMDILARVACPENAADILAELSEYVTDIDEQLARRAIRSCGTVASRVREAAPRVLETLLQFSELDVDHVQAETVIVLKDLLRKFPGSARSVVPSLHAILKRIEDEQGKAAVVWMLGEYGELIEEGPYMMEPLIDSFAEESSEVKLQMLIASVKLFFKRPPEVQRMLGRLFAAALDEGMTMDVRDRALLYYRLLRHDVGAAKRVVAAPLEVQGQFLEEAESDNRIFDEMDTLSVVYQMPSDRFVAKDHRSAVRAEAAAPAAATSGGAAATPAQGGDEDLLGSGADDSSLLSTAAPASTAAAAAPGSGGDLLGDGLGDGAQGATGSGGGGGGDLDDLLSFGLSSASAPASGFALAASPSLTPPEFQAKWKALPVGHRFEGSLSRCPASVGEVEQALRPEGVLRVAAGDVGHMFKVYLFAQKQGAASQHLLAELLINKSPPKFGITVKGDTPADVQPFSDKMRGLLAAM